MTRTASEVGRESCLLPSDAVRVFLTGHKGFAGRHLTNALTSAGAVVTGFDGDVRDQDALRRELHAAQPDAIAHLAAAASVAEAWSRPFDAWDINATGTLNVPRFAGLRAARPRSRRLVC